MKRTLAQTALALALAALLSGCGTFWVLSHDFLAPEAGHGEPAEQPR